MYWRREYTVPIAADESIRCTTARLGSQIHVIKRSALAQIRALVTAGSV